MLVEINPFKSNSNSSSTKQKVETKSVVTPKEYYKVSFYCPLLYPQRDLSNYVIYDLDGVAVIKDVKSKNWRRTTKDYREQFCSDESDFPIYVEKVGNKIFDVLTNEEYMLVVYEPGESNSQLRYKGKYYNTNEKFLQNKLAFHLVDKITEMKLADELRSLTPEAVARYKQSIDKIKNIVFWTNNDYFAEKKKYESTHLSDAEYIRRFRKNNGNK
jgi:hypothetical protein